LCLYQCINFKYVRVRDEMNEYINLWLGLQTGNSILYFKSHIKKWRFYDSKMNFFFSSHRQNSHYQRACDTLRIIIKEFLPVIQANVDHSWTRGLGVDVSREERTQKCMECRNWLMKIRCLPENTKIGTSLLPLQNMIVDI
jgi:hypothetical protein